MVIVERRGEGTSSCASRPSRRQRRRRCVVEQPHRPPVSCAALRHCDRCGEVNAEKLLSGVKIPGEVIQLSLGEDGEQALRDALARAALSA